MRLFRNNNGLRLRRRSWFKGKLLDWANWFICRKRLRVKLWLWRRCGFYCRLRFLRNNNGLRLRRRSWLKRRFDCRLRLRCFWLRTDDRYGV